MKKYLIVLMLFIMAGCSAFEDAKRNEGVGLYKGYSELYAELGTMTGPKGILPEGFAYSYPGVINRSTAGFHEFFVYDKDKVLVILSVNPMYFMKIESDQFYFHLGNELEQMRKSVTPSAKTINTIPEYKQVGDLEVGIYFTPNEIKYSTGGKIADSNGVSYVDPYILYDAADKVVFYTPSFTEEKLFNDFLEDKIEGRTRVQYCRSATFSNTIITYYTKPEIPVEFSFIFGEGLRIIDRIGSGDLLGTTKIEFADLLELTKNFAFFTSVPLGNSQVSAEAYLADSTAGRHGIAVVVRGDISRLKSFLEIEGINFEPAASLPVSLIFTDTYGSSLSIGWGDERTAYLYYKKTSDPDIPANWTAANAGQAITGKSYALTGLARGEKYDFKLLDVDNTTSLATASFYYTGLVISEVCFYGSSYKEPDGSSNDDDWVEVKNISSVNIDLATVDFFLKNSTGTLKYICGPTKPAGFTSSSYNPVAKTLAPGEYYVVAVRDTYFFNVTHYAPNVFTYWTNPLSWANLTNWVKKGTVSNSAISSGYKVYLEISGQQVFSMLTDDDIVPKQYKADPFRSIVLSSSGTYIPSAWDISQTSTATGMNVGRDFCSPGFAAPGEY